MSSSHLVSNNAGTRSNSNNFIIENYLVSLLLQNDFATLGAAIISNEVTLPTVASNFSGSVSASDTIAVKHRNIIDLIFNNFSSCYYSQQKHQEHDASVNSNSSSSSAILLFPALVRLLLHFDLTRGEALSRIVTLLKFPQQQQLQQRQQPVDNYNINSTFVSLQQHNFRVMSEIHIALLNIARAVSLPASSTSSSLPSSSHSSLLFNKRNNNNSSSNNPQQTYQQFLREHTRMQTFLRDTSELLDNILLAISIDGPITLPFATCETLIELLPTVINAVQICERNTSLNTSAGKSNSSNSSGIKKLQIKKRIIVIPSKERTARLINARMSNPNYRRQMQLAEEEQQQQQCAEARNKDSINIDEEVEAADENIEQQELNKSNEKEESSSQVQDDILLEHSSQASSNSNSNKNNTNEPITTTCYDLLIKILDSNWRPQCVLSMLNMFVDVQAIVVMNNNSNNNNNSTIMNKLKLQITTSVSCLDKSDYAGLVKLLLQLAEKYQSVEYIDILRSIFHLLVHNGTPSSSNSSSSFVSSQSNGDELSSLSSSSSSSSMALVRLNLFFIIEMSVSHSKRLLNVIMASIKRTYCFLIIVLLFCCCYLLIIAMCCRATS